MKSVVKLVLQKILGFRNYLFVFSLFKVITLKWDRKEKDFFVFMDLVPEGSLVLDIGANLGIMTTLLARSEKKLKVIAFEPVPINLEILKKVVSFFRLNNVNCRNYALGDSDGSAEMVMPVINKVKMQGLSHILHEDITENNQGVKFNIEVKKLDHLTDLPEPARAIKLDVENFEFRVLKGAETLLKRDRPIVYAELWENENRDKTFNLMKNLGYTIHVVNERNIVNYDPEKHKTQNFIFITQS